MIQSLPIEYQYFVKSSVDFFYYCFIVQFKPYTLIFYSTFTVYKNDLAQHYQPGHQKFCHVPLLRVNTLCQLQWFRIHRAANAYPKWQWKNIFLKLDLGTPCQYEAYFFLKHYMENSLTCLLSVVSSSSSDSLELSLKSSSTAKSTDFSNLKRINKLIFLTKQYFHIKFSNKKKIQI